MKVPQLMEDIERISIYKSRKIGGKGPCKEYSEEDINTKGKDIISPIQQPVEDAPGLQPLRNGKVRRHWSTFLRHKPRTSIKHILKARGFFSTFPVSRKRETREFFYLRWLVKNYRCPTQKTLAKSCTVFSICHIDYRYLKI